MKFYLAIFVCLLLVTFGLLWTVNDHVAENTQLTLAPPEKIVPEKTVPPPSDPIVRADTLGFTAEELRDTVAYRMVNGHAELTWKALSKMKFNEVYSEDAEAYVPYPIFHPSIKALDGKLIQIKGYVIPIEETEDESILVLSAYAYKNCFFCGGAGPETVMDIQLRKKQRGFKIDQTTTFRGRLKLNDEDLYYLNYIMEDAVPVRAR